MTRSVTLEHNKEYDRPVVDAAVCRRCDEALDWKKIDNEMVKGAFWKTACCGLYYGYFDNTMEITNRRGEPYTPPDGKRERPADDPLGQIECGDECTIEELEHAVCNRCHSDLEWSVWSGDSLGSPPVYEATCCDRAYTFKPRTVVATVDNIRPKDRSHSAPPESCTFDDDLYPSDGPHW